MFCYILNIEAAGLMVLEKSIFEVSFIANYFSFSFIFQKHRSSLKDLCILRKK